VKLALNVKDLADARGLSPQELASQTGVDENLVSALYNGEEVDLDLTTLGHISTALGVLPNEVVADVIEPQQSITDGVPMPRSIDVPVQTMDQIKKG
jgi:DNA-binding Xre family transcriptional regulator